MKKLLCRRESEYGRKRVDRMRGHSAGPSTSVGSQAPFFTDRRPHADQWRAVKRFLWNSEKRTCCNRSCKNWLQLLVFYSIFLVVIFGFTALLLYGISTYIRDNRGIPFLSKSDIMYSEDTGMGSVRAPRIARSALPPDTMWYNLKGDDQTDRTKPDPYVAEISKYLQKYHNPTNHSGKYVNCTVGQPKPENKICTFDPVVLGPCSREDYGFREMKPCLYLRINRLDGWSPKAFNAKNLPVWLPQRLKRHITQAESLDNLWLDCDGYKEMDKRHLGEIDYYPAPSYPGYYFPYNIKDRDDYISPLVAIKLNNIQPGYFLSITCRLYAANISPNEEGLHQTIMNIYVDKDD